MNNMTAMGWSLRGRSCELSSFYFFWFGLYEVVGRKEWGVYGEWIASRDEIYGFWFVLIKGGGGNEGMVIMLELSLSGLMKYTKWLC